MDQNNTIHFNDQRSASFKIKFRPGYKDRNGEPAIRDRKYLFRFLGSPFRSLSERFIHQLLLLHLMNPA